MTAFSQAHEKKQSRRRHKSLLESDVMRAAVSPLKTREPHAVAAARARLFTAQRTACVDEARLLRAIRALDTEAPEPHSGSSSRDASFTRKSAKRICDALAFLLTLLLQLEQSAQEDSVARAELETIWEARVLGCLKRFVAKRKHVDDRFVGCSCSMADGPGCIQRLVCYTLAATVFSLARDARMASSVVKNELHNLVLDHYFESRKRDQSQHAPAENLTAGADNKSRDDSALDPRDLLLVIDPFDWCYKPTCAQIASDRRSDDAVFLVPAGVRSLTYLLAGEALPTDEITEYDTKSRRSGGAAALQHMALRSAAALLQSLRRASPERKLLLHDGNCIKMLLAALSHPQESATESQQQWRDGVDAGLSPEMLGCQKMAITPRLLARIARCALSLLHEGEVETFLKKQPDFRDVFSRCLQGDDVAGRISSQPSALTKKQKETKAGNQTRVAVAASKTVSLAERLRAASEESRRESAAQSPLKRELGIERSARRQQLRLQCESLEQLREQLRQDLSLLYLGRPHADPSQSFVSWIASLPTTEKNEQERHLNERLREQHAIEMQFQRDEARKRRLKESALMQQNDFDAFSETEVGRREQKRLEFLRMHDEMRLLQQQQQQREAQHGGLFTVRSVALDDDHDQQVSDIEAKMLQQETLAAQRKARQQKLNDEQTRRSWVRERKQEAQELERMGKEDLYYVERLLRIKQEKQLQLQQLKVATVDPIEEQQRKIARMRQLDQERKAAEKETERMRTEDLAARQLRYLDSERKTRETQQEKLARKHMEAQEHDCRARWIRIAQAQAKLEELEAKRMRVEARQLLKWQQAYDKQVLAAWVESWDELGNGYYYNTVTGVSQWESPFVVAQQQQ